MRANIASDGNPTFLPDETMLIEFRCGNYSVFDEATGEHASCGQKMSAAPEDAGLMVDCPKCHHPCEVPSPSSNKPGGQDRTKRRSPTNRCPKCGGRLNKRGACSSCRWVRPKHFKSEQSLDEMEMKPAGMMLWFSDIISEGVPANVFCLAAIVALSLLLCALMAFSIFVLGGVFGGLLFLLSFAALLLFAGMSFKGHQFLRDGNAELAWFQKPFWNGILAISRQRQWEGNDRKLKDRKVLVLRGKQVTDEVLVQHEEFKWAHVLDLEGSAITDDTIRLLYRHKNLQCLVVRDTEVSHLAATRLQQSFPKLWIWR